MKTQYNNSLAVVALASATISTNTATNGAAVDLGQFGNDFMDVLFVISTGTITDGSYAVSVQESDVSGSGYGAVDGWRVLGTTAIAATDDNKVFTVGVRPTKQFVRLVITSTSVTAGGVFSAVAVLGSGSVNPVARA